MKTMALDLGNKTLGIAVSDELGFLARGLETFRFAEKSFAEPLAHVLELIRREDVKTVVLGYPKNMDGTVGEQGEISEAFATELRAKTSVPVVLWDERLTSRQASNLMKEQQLKRKQRSRDIDKMAAIVILQSYLDRRN